MMKKLLALAIFAAATKPLWAAPQSITLVVPSMNCASCPITVKKALTKVVGVEKVEINLEKREARVSFDDVKTTALALAQATKDAGYPSTLSGATK